VRDMIVFSAGKATSNFLMRYAGPNHIIMNAPITASSHTHVGTPPSGYHQEWAKHRSLAWLRKSAVGANCIANCSFARIFALGE
jgi:hypothetical protein